MFKSVACRILIGMKLSLKFALVTMLMLSMAAISCGDSQELPSEARGFEIIEIRPDGTLRAWISPEITYDEFIALEVPAGWIKNQPRTGSASAETDSVRSRFLRSPDASEEGEIVIEELFGFNWFHAATIIDSNVPLDDSGILRGVRVRKFHEVTFGAGSQLVLWESPGGDLYFRIGRDADRTVDVPTIPEGWTLAEVTTPGELVLLLAPENIVIRTDNEDSFQGPLPELEALL